jgi:hypothetical protein
MKLSICNTILCIDDCYTSYSPYLTTLATTEVKTDKQGEAYILDIFDVQRIHNYLAFLEGKEFEYDPEVFDFMGHENHVGYDDEFFKVKLRDTWIRDNCYKLNLFKDPYYGLIKLQVKEDRIPKTIKNGNLVPVELPKDHYIAGGLALYMSGYADNYSDMDIFTCNKQSSEKFLCLETYKKGGIWVTGNAIALGPWYLEARPNDKEHTTYDEYGFRMHSTKVQLVTRIYSCPSEIVHGFDVGSCGVIYDGKDLWCTERAKFCVDNKCNWFEPDRCSPSYAQRLCKYYQRGYEIKLPGLEVNIRPEIQELHDLLVQRAQKFLSSHENVFKFDTISSHKLVKYLYQESRYYLNRYNADEYDHQYWIMRFMKDKLGLELDPEEWRPEIKDAYNVISYLYEHDSDRRSHKDSPDYSSFFYRYAHTKQDNTYEYTLPDVQINMADYISFLRYELNDYFSEEIGYVLSMIEADCLETNLGLLFYMIRNGTMYGSTEDEDKYDHDIENFQSLVDQMPVDSLSLILWQTKFNISYKLLSKPISDYAKNKPVMYDIKDIKWKEHNPMEQEVKKDREVKKKYNESLTNTFYPTPLDDIIEWYKQCPMIRLE